MVLVAAIALGSSTYAWFVNNTQVTATDVSVTATTAYSLQIKHYKSGSYGTTTPLNTANVQLVPVSTVGGTNENIAFFKSNEWDKDGNVKSFTTATVTNVNNSTDNNLTSVGYTNAENPGSPYYVDTVYFKAGQTSNLYFDGATTGLTTKGDETGVQTSLTKFNAASGENAEILKAMRIGVLVSDTDGANGKFFVYQLNSTPSTQAVNTTSKLDSFIVKEANGLNAGVVSESNTAAFTTANIVNFASNTLPVLDEQCATASASSLASVASTITPLYNFSVTGTVGDKTECKAVIYIWMEGCDYDTVAANTVNFAKFANEIQLGFCVGTTAS